VVKLLKDNEMLGQTIASLKYNFSPGSRNESDETCESHMYREIIKSLFETNKYSKESLVSTLDSLEPFFEFDDLDNIFQNVCNSRIRNGQNFTDIFSKIKIILDRMIAKGSDPDQINFMKICDTAGPRRILMIKYLIDNDVNFMRETVDGRNLLFLIEERFYCGRDHCDKINCCNQSMRKPWEGLHYLITTMTPLKTSGHDSENRTPQKRKHDEWVNLNFC
jgi:hypothetical protein